MTNLAENIQQGNLAEELLRLRDSEGITFAALANKTGITAGDEDVRDSHRSQNGVTVPIEQPFPNGLMYPGDPSGAPGEIIRCRCDMLPGDF